jgi:hypothetical protein
MAFLCGHRCSVALRSAFSFVFQSQPAALAAMTYRSLSTQSASLLAHTVDRYGAVHVDTGKLPNVATPATATARDGSAASIEFASQLDASLISWQAAGRKAAWIQLRTQTRHFVHTRPLLQCPCPFSCRGASQIFPPRILTIDPLYLYYATRPSHHSQNTGRSLCAGAGGDRARFRLSPRRSADAGKSLICRPIHMHRRHIQTLFCFIIYHKRTNNSRFSSCRPSF